MKTPKNKQTAIAEEAVMPESDDCRVTDQMWAFIESIGGATSCLLTGDRGIAEWPAEVDAINVEGAAFAANLGMKITDRLGDGWTGTQSLDGVDAFGAPARIVYVVSKQTGAKGGTVGISYTRHLSW